MELESRPLESAKATLDNRREELAGQQRELEDTEKMILDADRKFHDAARESEQRRRVLQEHERAEAKRQALSRQLANLDARLHSAKRRVKTLRAQIISSDDLDAAHADLVRAEHLRAGLNRLGAERRKVDDDASAIMRSHRVKLEQVRERRQEAEEEVARLNLDLRAGESRLDGLRSGLVREEAQAKAHKVRLEGKIAVLEGRRLNPEDLTCQACGQPLPPDQKERLRQQQADLDTEIAEVLQKAANRMADWEVRRDEIEQLIEKHVTELGVQRAAHTTAKEKLLKIVDPSLPILPEFRFANELRATERELAGIDERGLRDTIQQAEKAAGSLESMQETVAQLEEQYGELKAEIDDVQVDGQPPGVTVAAARLDVADQDQRRCQQDLSKHEILRARQQETIRTLRERIGQLQADYSRYMDLQEKAMTAEYEQRSWKQASDMLGPDGLQSVLLEAAAPAVADAANRMLHAGYGPRWTIRLEMQKVVGSGSNRRMAEDVRILVRDSQRLDEIPPGDDMEPGEQDISSLSGGESVWVRAALAAAIAEVRASSTGLRFDTAVLDEADDGLDPDARSSYFRMIEQADRYQTLVVSHDISVQDRFSTVVRLG